MVSSVGSSGALPPDTTIYRRKVSDMPVSNVGVGPVYKPRLGGLAPPAMIEHIKQMSAAAKGAQAQYDAMAKMAAEMAGPPSDFLVAARAALGLDRFGRPVESARPAPAPAVFVDTKV